ncbi:MAG TPA: alpha/beta family hydrolase [Myxococcales bacterium]|nr:alpha/beta family hydrolase [Myxococcales bacterium]
MDELRFEAGADRLDALLLRPDEARLLYVLAHGAGADMRHVFLHRIAEALADSGVATFRFQFPYTQAKRRRPDEPTVLRGAVRAAVSAAHRAAPDLPLIAGGKSMGGRMTTQAQAEAPLAGARGIALLGFPLHPARRPSTSRAEHLPRVEVPLLFLQGTRDDLADLSLLRPIVGALPRAQMRVIEGADHSFHMLKRSGRSDADVISELAAAVAEWGAGL